ncbi:hypothetical protein ACE1CM_06535 [Microseira sp. BLCC-F43]
MVQNVSLSTQAYIRSLEQFQNSDLAPLTSGMGKMPIPQAKFISCGVEGWARCPSHKQNSSLVGWKDGQDAHPTSKIHLLWGGRPARPPHWCKM